MKQSAEFLGARRQAPVTDAADRGRVVGHDGHRELHTGAVPPFVTQLSDAPTQQAGDDTFHHRTAGACRTGQPHLAGSAFVMQVGGGERLLDGCRRRRGREGLDRAWDTDCENASGVQTCSQGGVVYGQVPGQRVDARSSPRGDTRTGGLDQVDQGQDVADITGIAHRQPGRKHKAGGGLGEKTGLAAKLGGAVTLAFADRGNGGIVGIDDFTPRQGLAVGEAARLGDNLLMGDESESQRGVPARPLVCRQLGGALDLRLGGVRNATTGSPVVNSWVSVWRTNLTKTFPCPRHCRPKRRIILASSWSCCWACVFRAAPWVGHCAAICVMSWRTFFSPCTRWRHH